MKINEESNPDYYVPSKLDSLISIYSYPKTLRLAPGIYHIYFSRGWIIDPRSFRILLTHNHRNKEVKVYKTNWPIQDLKNWKRINRTYSFEIEEYGEYLLEFINPEDVLMKRSNFFFFRMFLPYVDTSDVHVLIEKAW